VNWVVWASLFLLVVALRYAASCVWRPFANCVKCEGKGRFARADGKVWRKCPRCKGGGARLRVGRKMWNYMHHQRKAAKRARR
jgi:hypothetical protein